MLSFSQVKDVLPGVNGVGVSSAFTGNYASLLSFLQGLENNERKIKVRSLNVQVLSGEGNQVTFGLSMEAYYQ